MTQKVKLPITEYVDTEERYCYGISSDNERDAFLNEAKSGKTVPQSGLVGKTGKLIGAIGSSIWSSATGAVSLGVDAVCTGVSAGSSVVSGVISYLPFPRRAAPTDEPSQSQEVVAEQKPNTPPPAKSGILSKVLLRGPTKDKAD
ncbi:hypothetical protein EGR_08560 [Echinococcus granulosus]|uniref:Expressed conserved protein n=1 Tax=Echinococcus granulosus TaxID=6210 RepID=U6JDZ3_ECHGR|nr:hypothetical protein EGR_08560 [Echinococcus granulosus]EUB56594.1 hypothetical protein EGR_08560 [Echinococcus granulosus]CDS21556.1 expressed conserved protein [Echinococcus granulosus]